MLEELLSVVDDFRIENDAWIDDGTPCFTNNVVVKTKETINKITDLNGFEVFPTYRNSIQLEYENNDDYLEFEIFGDRIECYSEKRDIEQEFKAKLDEINKIINDFKKK